jgi:hypothetical protein
MTHPTRETALAATSKLIEIAYVAITTGQAVIDLDAAQDMIRVMQRYHLLEERNLHTLHDPANGFPTVKFYDQMKHFAGDAMTQSNDGNIL